MPSAPPSVVDGLEVSEAQEGLVVFDPASDLIHYLNSTSAIVFTLCDGSHSPLEIASVVSGVFGLDEPPLDEVALCLKDLRGKGLLR
jgi:hypothetical protein